MCLGISAPDGGRTELTFVQEQIFLRKNGSKDVRVDLLIKNVGGPEIKRFRIELPCRLITDADLGRSDNESKEQSFTRLCHEQCTKVRIDTTRLADRNASDNWLYKILPHISLGDYDFKTGELCCTRDETERLTGLVKHDWKVAVSRELGDDPDRWFVCFANAITVVDFVAPAGKLKEHLRTGESMWISVEFTVPCSGIQYMLLPSFGKRVFGQKRSFPVILMSPKAFLESKTNQFTIFGRRTKPEETKLKVAVGNVREILGQPNLPEVFDWRLFLYWSKRISIQRIKMPEEIIEPPPDHVLHEEKTSWFLFKGQANSDPEHRDEFWFGHTFKAPEPTGGFCIELKAHVDNLLYKYLLPWLGFIGFCLAVLRWVSFLVKGRG